MLGVVFGAVQLVTALILFLNVFSLPKGVFLVLAGMLTLSGVWKVITSLVDGLEE